MQLPQLQKKNPFVIKTKIIIETNNEKYSLQKSSLPIDNIISITRQNKKLENIEFTQKLSYPITKSYIRRKH